MTDSDALLAAIRAAPDDDAPRLIYADWLDEHGQPERAEFIRLSVQCVRASVNDKERCCRQMNDFLYVNHAVLMGQLAASGTSYVWRRGFIMAFEHDGAFVGGNPPGHHMLRFYGDGHVIGGTFADTWASRSNLHRYRLDLPCGQYTLDALDYPARLRFTLTGLAGSTDFDGVMEGAWLILDQYDRQSDQRYRDHYRLDPEAGPERRRDPDPQLLQFVDSPLDEGPTGEEPAP
jgi:uncharacterized protein (TIGR02996 family)